MNYIIRTTDSKITAEVETALKQLGALIQGQSERQFSVIFNGDISKLKEIKGVKIVEPAIIHIRLDQTSKDY
jgi:hypothetical protein